MSLAALACLLAQPALLWIALRQTDRPGGGLVMALIVAAVAATATAVLALFTESIGNLSVALWFGLGASLLTLSLAGLWRREAWRLAAPMAVYGEVLALAAVLVELTAGKEGEGARYGDLAWLGAHVVVSVATYGVLTVAAVAGLAVFLQERSLKRRTAPTRMIRVLPAAADAEEIQSRLLLVSAWLLGAGVLTGVAVEYLRQGRLLIFDHKTVLTLVALAVVVVLLLLDRRLGLGGRRIARVVLFAYLLITLAYPGVKFVTQILM